MRRTCCGSIAMIYNFLEFANLIGLNGVSVVMFAHLGLYVGVMDRVVAFGGAWCWVFKLSKK